MLRQWQQILAAIILGVLVPAMAARLGEGAAKLVPTIQTQPTEAVETTVPVPAPEPEPEPDPYQIPVLHADGNVIYMELDEYVIGVVLAEMPASFEEEALKAQAVVARTYAMKRITDGKRHPQGAVCTDYACCQAYISPENYQNDHGTQENVLKITRAVEATAGQVLTYNGKLAEATYFSCSGGRTEDAVAVWGNAVPYLQAVDSPGEEEAAPYRKTVSFTPTEFAKALGRSLSGDPKSWLGPVTYTNGYGVDTMQIAGVSYTGVRLRQLLKLNSTAFTVTVVDGKIQITTSGMGHRVGMSQYGADAMAVTGSTCQEILSHYYPGTKIDKIDAIG